MSRYLATIVKKKKKKLKSNAKNYFLSRFYLSFYLKRTKKKMRLTLLIKFTRGKFKYSLHIFNNYNNMVAIIIFFFFYIQSELDIPDILFAVKWAGFYTSCSTIVIVVTVRVVICQKVFVKLRHWAWNKLVSALNRNKNWNYVISHIFIMDETNLVKNWRKHSKMWLFDWIVLLKHLFEILIQDYHDFKTRNQVILIYIYICVRKEIIILIKLRLKFGT